MTEWRFSIEQLREAVKYDPQSGALTWLERPRAHFSSDRVWRSTNRQFAGKQALPQISRHGYLVGCIFQQKIMSHQVAFALMSGRWPAQIDHINGDKTDNRWDNLREVTSVENARNAARQKRNSSGFPGVRWNPAMQCWVAYIGLNRKTQHLGSFKTKEEAVARRKAAEKQHGFHSNHGRDAVQARAA